MRYTVFGATGGTGKELVRQALDAGHQVTAVVRDPARLPVRHERLDVVTAQVTGPDTDLDALRGAVEGRDAVFSALGPPDRKPTTVTSEGVRTILRAMEATDARRFLAVSAAPLGRPAEDESLLTRRLVLPVIKRVFRQVYADLAVMEEEIRGSATEWTVVRPPMLLDKPVTGEYRTSTGANVRGAQKVARADLAHAMLAMTEDKATYKQAVCVAY
ncbi:SDR family oxidoreductase [Streptomyces sp. ODS28]|uniref:NAD(P)-dependent oxidoreductase n=1 Tax=Streptomyces sp. ODS28 TaxID=3136688 RepID=UPI0031E5022B